MKAVVVLSVLLVACPLAVKMDIESDDLVEALILLEMTENYNCAPYGHQSQGRRCCQYLGYSNMVSISGVCLQEQCASGAGAWCSATHHCCYHEQLTCLLGQQVCGYVENNYQGKK